ncbi:hypothetical protein BH11ARM2_BH11ARM2_12050 [soil metagenome]
MSSRSFSPTQEQSDVIGTDLARFVVAASAGSGKTSVLTQRYLRHIEEGIGPHEILTITFTKKAAAEMKRRIVDALRAKDLYEEAQIAETGPISTIHSFCERILRENAFEAGLDPKFGIMPEADTARILATAVRDALGGDLSRAPYAESLVAFLAGRPAYGNSDPYAQLETSVRQVVTALRSSGNHRGDIAERYASPGTARAHWRRILFGELSLSPLDGSEGTIAQALVDACMVERMKAPRWMLTKADAGDARAEDESLLHTCGLVGLALLAWERLEDALTARQELDFGALEARAVDLVATRPAVRERLQRQYKVVMVDEAQDLNLVQYRLLRAISSENLILVGDAQQSIYAFRQADVRLFRSASDETFVFPLTRNFRSDVGVQRFIDATFGMLWPEAYRPMLADKAPFDLDDEPNECWEGIEWWREQAKGPSPLAIGVRALRNEGWNDRIAVLVRGRKGATRAKEALDADGIANRLVGISEGFYTNLEIRDVANALRALSDPCDGFALLATLYSPIGGLSLDSIVVLAAKEDPCEAIDTFDAVLERDKEPLERFREWFLPLRGFADRIPAWEVLSELFAQSPYLENLARRPDAEQRLANVRKLLTLAAADPTKGPLRFAEEIREVQRLDHREGNAPIDVAIEPPPVEIVTIHGSKGLEWPCVIFFDTADKLTRRGGPLEIDATSGLVATKFSASNNVMHSYLAFRRKERELQEELRLLYVGFTRAQSKLVVVADDTVRDDSFAKRLAPVLRRNVPGFIRRDLTARVDSEA